MKRFILFALLALCTGFALDAAVDTGFKEDLQTLVIQTDYEDTGTAIMFAAAGAAVIVPGVDSVQADGKPKLWVISQDEFNQLEAKYKRLYIIDIAFDADERYQFIAKRPTKDVIQAVGESKDSPFKVSDMMIKNMIVAGNTEALDDGVVYSHVIKQLAGVIKDGKALFTKA